MVPLVNRAFSVETFVGGVRTDVKEILAMMRTGTFFVAEDDASVLLASVYAEIRENRCGYFGMLSVNASKQGAGLGRTMIETAEAYCIEMGCTHMEITVLTPRTELFPYYRKFGYSETRVEEFRTDRPIQDGVECGLQVMSKVL